MRISINGHYLHRRMSGLARYAQLIKSQLHEDGHKVLEIMPPPFFYRAGGKFKQLIRFVALVVYEMFAPPLLLAAGRIDTHVSPAFAAPLGIFSPRYIVVYHDLAFIEFHSLYSLLERLYLHLNLWILQVGRHRIVTPSEFVKRQLCAHTGISPERVFVISPYSEFTPADRKTEPSSKYFLLLSNAHPRKNLAATVAGFLASQAPKAGYELLIVGNFELPVELANSNVRIKKGVSDEELRSMLINSAALILFSLSEGFGFPIVEAARLGVVSLTSGAGSLSELIAPGKKQTITTTETEIRDIIDLFLSSQDFVASLEQDRTYVDKKFSKDSFTSNWRKLINDN